MESFFPKTQYNETMTILYLYTNVMGYTFATINELLKKEIEVHVVHWNKKEIAHHFIYERENLFIHKRDENDFKSLDSLINKINPRILVFVKVLN